MADGKTSASVVAVDAESAAKERDAAARAMLQDGGVSPVGKAQLLKKGLVHTVPYTLKVVVADPKEMEKAAADAEQVLQAAFQVVDTLLNNFNENSEVSRINRMPVGEEHQMSAALKHVMACCQKVYNSSRGAFDPAVGPLVRELREAAHKGKTVPAEHVNDLLSKCTLNASFSIDMNRGMIARKHADAMLDLGGVNKGYGIDYIVERLNSLGYNDVFFEWGGDVRASGKNQSNQPWAVGIVRPPALADIRTVVPEDKRSFIRVVRLNNEAIATSGDYENLIEGPGSKVYSSTFDPASKNLLEPTEADMAQVSVKCYSCMYADALATAALLKNDPAAVRRMLDNWRYVRDTVTDYTTYTREGERVAKMLEIATEDAEMRAKRIKGSLPARVIIVGGGLAGCSAAIEAANCGAQVILLEKEPKLGGNSAKATSGINAWGTRAQAKQGVMDGGKFFERDTHRSGKGGNCDPCLVKTLSVKSSDAVKWLSELGVPLTVLSQLGGASRKRCHRAPDKSDGTPVPVGFTIMKTLENHIVNNLSRHVTVMTGITVTALESTSRVRPDGVLVKHVTGVRLIQSSGQSMVLNADAVVLATGGFSNDHTPNSLLQQYAPQLSSFPTTNGVWATGDGVKMASKLGVTLVDMDKVQLHPTGLLDPKDPSNRTKYLGPEALRGSGGVLLNKNGERFVNELDLRSVVSQAIIAQDNVYPGSGGSKFAYCVLNETAAKLFGKNFLGFYWNRLGLFQKVDSVAGLAKLIGCPEANVMATLKQYEELSSKKLNPCPLTGKNVFPCVLGTQGPYYVALVTPSIHYTMGGCLISPSAEMQTIDNSGVTPVRRPILGLFGAGEVTGGVHGGNRLGGNSLLECVVFGKIAGDRAATILQKKSTGLSTTEWSTVVLREVREGGVYGAGSRVLRFNMPGALQRTGLALGQFIGIRGDWDGHRLIGYYSPITLPDDVGVIGILARADKGRLAEWISALQPGDAVEMKACGGLIIERRFADRHFFFRGHKIRKLALIGGGTGVAPMLQIVRAAVKKPFVDSIESIQFIYAAEDVSELTYRTLLESYEKEYGSEKFKCHFVLNNPPAQWTDGVGFVDTALLRSAVQAPSNDLLVAICGPPIMQRAVKGALKGLGYNMNLVRTVDETEPTSAKI
ncbi:putative NADH-dependent fumarate reductase [Leishmania infantum JPCM5]|uniref:fumarate reductase (NADH) n=2 Tax=Leishmania infantum TaxID=5671 RepID=A0A6L0XRG6_LEIIN|nr:putative NADH-dependent fumarate reductase [Leishmania infantum JPCM5]CAC9543617.1 NADH-dependent_fumarate_reductase_-_putative [Leishmania infantum]CAM72026.1 putative NADH-dependent fumarate reductase [Leishmania infantum JPCM5]SUZ45946.1 NADH-dependent_fumarate_reductase_-_putative [Leishmania infantum]|eukprot:XP_001468931.1 putative NADH-dependent fumarate reductase [Leishmania infantum JPCM5]